jgi:hypothetical protein
LKEIAQGAEINIHLQTSLKICHYHLLFNYVSIGGDFLNRGHFQDGKSHKINKQFPCVKKAMIKPQEANKTFTSNVDFAEISTNTEKKGRWEDDYTCVLYFYFHI